MNRSITSLFLSLAVICAGSTYATAGDTNQGTLLHFPDRTSLGQLYVLSDQFPIWGTQRQRKAAGKYRKDLGEAKGSVQVPKSGKLMLQVDRPAAYAPSLLTVYGANSFAVLDFSKVKSDDQTMAKISELTGLQGLQLDGSSLSDKGLTLLGKLKGLKYLSMGGTAVTDRGLEVLQQLGSLTYLLLNGTKISNTGLKTIGNCHQLEFLSLAGCDISDAGLQSLAAAPALREICLNSNKKITAEGLLHATGFKRLEILDIQGTGVAVKDLPIIQKFRQKIPSLKVVRVAGSSFTSEAAQAWKHTFPHDEIDTTLASPTADRMLHFPDRTSLGELRCFSPKSSKDWPIFAEDLHKVGEARGTVWVPKKDYLFLHVSYAAAQDPSLLTVYGPTFFTELDFGAVEIDENTLAKISVLTGLRSLNLIDTDLPESAFKRLAGMKLEHLDLSGNAITNGGLASLLALPSLKSLQSIRLNQRAKINDTGLKSFQQCRQLEKLTLSNCQLTDAGLPSLAAVPSLKYLDVGGNSGITAKGLLQLIPLKHLSDLNIQKTGVTAKDLPLIRKLSRQLPSLNLILVCDKSLTAEALKQWRRGLPRLGIFGCPESAGLPAKDVEKVFAPLHSWSDRR